MAIGAGLSAQAGIVTEATEGTSATVTHFFEFNNESMQLKKNTVQGVGLRAGATGSGGGPGAGAGLYNRQSRRVIGSYGAAGNISFDAPYNSLGLLLEHMMGAFTVGTVGGTNNPLVVQQASSAAWLQTYAPGSLAGKTFTLQIGKPDVTGTVQPFTYVGCKVTDWQLDAEVNQFAKFTVGVDAWQELTLDNPTGSVAGPALATASYTSGEQFFHFLEATLYGGGTLATSAGVTTLSAPTKLANVTKLSLKVENKLEDSRYFFGGYATANGSGVAGVKSEQLENDRRIISGQIDAEFYSRASYYNPFASDSALVLEVTFVGTVAIASSYYPTLTVLIPAIRLDGESPKVGGPGLLDMTIPFTGLDDETDNQVQIQYMSTDTAP